MDSESRLKNVFLAVRTNFFDIPDEHMTIKYFRDVGYNTLLLHCQVFAKYLPIKIELDRPTSWEAEDNQYRGWLIKHNSMNPIFPAMPHITIPNGYTMDRPDKGVSWSQTHKTIFIGKRYRKTPDDLGYIDWLRVNNNELDYERVFKLGYETTV